LRRRDFAGRFNLMPSAGGLASPEVARRFPIRLPESGPAGGGSIAAIDEVRLFKVGRRAPAPTRAPWLWPRRADRDRRQSAARVRPRFLPRRAGEARSRYRRTGARPSRPPTRPVDRWGGRGVYSIVCESMAAAARVHLVEKGHDPLSAMIPHDYLVRHVLD